jgi:hypothetical protein
MKLALGTLVALPLFMATPALAEQVLYCFPNGQAMLFSGSDATGYSVNAAGACAGGPWVTVLELTVPHGPGGTDPIRDRAGDRAFAQLSRVPVGAVATKASARQIKQMHAVTPRSTLRVRADRLPRHVVRLLST